MILGIRAQARYDASDVPLRVGQHDSGTDDVTAQVIAKRATR